MKKANTFKINLLLIFSSILIVLLLAEVILRFLYYPNSKQDYRNMLSKNEIYPMPAYSLRKETNQLLSNPKNLNNKYNIAILGDSFVYGWGADYEDSFPSILETILKRKIPNVQVINLGSPGKNLIDYYQVYKYLTERASFDQVVIYVNNNDRYFEIGNPFPSIYCPNLKSASWAATFKLIQYSKLAYLIYNLITKPGIVDRNDKLESDFCKCNSIYFKKLINDIGDKALVTYYKARSINDMDKLGCSQLKTIDPTQVADRLLGKTSFININDFLFRSDCKFNTKLFLKDNYHLNRTANTIIAKTLAKEILTKLRL